MPIANDKRRRPERTEAIRILKPAMSNIPKRVSGTGLIRPPALSKWATRTICQKDKERRVAFRVEG
jgi:hypothetical protein